MIRLIIGILLAIKASVYAVIFLVFLTGFLRYHLLMDNSKSFANTEAGAFLSAFFALLFGIPGLILIKSGKKALNFQKLVLESSFKMIRKMDHIDILALMKEVYQAMYPTITFSCPRCLRTLECNSRKAGESVTCRKCKNSVSVPIPINSVDEIKMRTVIIKAQRKGLLPTNINII